MIGYLRFVLASLVLYSHLNYPVWHILDIRINQGVYAVFCFYLISGFFTAVIYDRYHGDGRVLKYYLDRFLRIMPTFLVVMLVVIILNLVWYEPTLKASPSDYKTPLYWFWGFIQPLNGIIAFFYRGDFPYGPFFAFTPVASLALEVQYFSIFPFIARARAIWIVVMMIIASALIINATSEANPDLLENYTYRYLIGVLPLFLLGFLFYKHIQSPSPKWIRFEIFGPLLGVVFFGALLFYKPSSTVWLGEMALAMITCPVLMKLCMKVKSHKMDQLAGYVSYGVFLVHIPVLRFFHLKGNDYGEFIIALVMATAVSFLIHYIIENPVLQLRHKMAGKGMKPLIQT